MSENGVVIAICAALNMTEAAAQQLAYADDSAGISYLKVHELKEIIRALKGAGYDRVKLSVTANKPELIQMVRAAAKLELPAGTAPPVTAAPPPAAHIAAAHHVVAATPHMAAQQPGSSHKPPAPNVAPAFASPPPHAYGYNAAHGHNAAHPHVAAAAASSSSASKPIISAIPATSTSNAAAAQPAHIHTKKKKASKPHSFPTHPAYTYVVRAGDPPGIRDRMLVVLSTAARMDAYRVLKAVPGVSAAEVLEELATHPGNAGEQDLDPDILLLNIVARRETQQPQQGAGHYNHHAGYNNGYNNGYQGTDYNDPHHDYTAEDAALQEQEDRDMDRAIAESEKERDVIQQRKRNRVEELRSGREGYLSSAEFQRSILLFGCGDCCSANNSGNSSHSSPVKVPRPSNAVASPTSVFIGGSAHKPNTSTSNATVATPAAASNGANHVGGSAARPISILRRDVVDSLITAAAATTGQHLQQKQRSTPQSNNKNQGTGQLSSHVSNNVSINNTSSSGGRGSVGGSSMDVVDLTCDTSDSDCEVQPVHSALRSPALSPERISLVGAHSGGSGSTSAAAPACPGPFSKPDNPSQSSAQSAHSAIDGHSGPSSGATSSATKTGAAAQEVDMSRSKVLHKLAQLLDDLTEYQDMLGCGNGESAGSSGNGNSSSAAASSSSSSSGASHSLRQHIHDVTSVHSCSTQGLHMIAQLRAAVSRLLLLENNAVKFYPKTSSAYLLFLARRIDKKLLCYSLDDAVNCVVCKPAAATTGSATGAATSTNNANNGADCILTLPAERIFIRYGAVTEYLDRICAKFERGMYKLPEDGLLVPALFRKPKLACFAHALATRIDTDGIEVVDAGAAQEMLGYEEALLSSDEESVQAEPSPYNSDEDD